MSENVALGGFMFLTQRSIY